MTTAEQLYPEQAEEIERGLACRVRDVHGCHEIVNISST
jgi:hypothetical protein